MGKLAKTLRGKNAEELQNELLSLRRENFNLRMQSAVQQNTKTSEVRRVRRQVARVLTLLGQKQQEAANV